MSAALLKRSLSIVEQNNKTKQKTEDKNIHGRNTKNVTSKTKRKFVEFNSAAIKKTKYDIIKNKIENSKSKLANENIEKLLKLSDFCGSQKSDMDSKTIKKLVQRARTERPILNVDASKDEEQTSIFTEEDFQNFEKEYFATK